MLDESKPSIDWDSLTFSFTETDRMFISKCEQGGAWEDGIMQDYQDLKISPAAGVINHGQGFFLLLCAIFEHLYFQL